MLNNGFSTTDPHDGEQVARLALDVENNADDAEVVYILVKAPEDRSFAGPQTAPPGWVVDSSRDHVEFVGHLDARASETFQLRVLVDSIDDRATLHGDSFDITVHCPSADCGHQTADVEWGTPDLSCQVVFAGAVDESRVHQPAASLSEAADTSAHVLLAFFDERHGEYLDPEGPGALEVSVHPIASEEQIDPFENLEATFTVHDGASLPVRDAVHQPVVVSALDNGAGDKVDSVPALEATLWDDETGDGDRLFFERNNGPFRITATSTGGPCDGAFYHAGSSLAPEAEAGSPQSATPVSILPPEVDSDGDGYSNFAELRAGSNPLLYTSTPYSDDDGDGVSNGQDAITVPSLFAG